MSSFQSQYSDGFFCVNPDNGFLPKSAPLKTLPEKYLAVQDICNRLHVSQEDGSSGILGVPNQIVDEVAGLPNLVDEVQKETDPFILQALFRAYSFLTSAFTLELSYQEFKKSGNYGPARRFLPKQVAQPFVAVSAKLDVFPWMDYHYSYSLGNYVKKDDNGSLNWENLGMAVKFAGTSDEIGFIMLHVYINELSPSLISSLYQVAEGVKENDVEKINSGLELNYKTIREMNSRRREMWKASNHKNYNDFRIFIMGIKGNDELFGDGLVYEGCFNDEPQNFRGQTGAQDDIIPTQDIFSGVMAYYPENKLTSYLMELREYRPKCVQAFFNDLQELFANKTVFNHLVETDNLEGLGLLWLIVDEIYRFRNGHWQFVQKYIMENTRYEKATGGTPITSWLINQIEACLKYQDDIRQALAGKQIGHKNKDILKEILAAFTSLDEKQALLKKQVEHLNSETNYNIELIYNWNKEHSLIDNPNEDK